MSEQRATTGSKEYFDALGSEWDRLQESFFSDQVREMAFDLAGIVGCANGRSASDIGAGTGFLTGGLLARGLQVIAVDRSPSMLEALERKYGSHSRLDCRVGDVDALPIADATVDCCFANMLLHHVDHPVDAIGEMVRILRPGGALVITDLGRHEHAFLQTEHHDRWLGFDREDLRRWFGFHGLDGVTVEGIGEQCCTASCEGESASISIFAAFGRRS